MTMVKKIATREEYDLLLKQGKEPLMSRYFDLDIRLRKEIQKERFGGNDAEGNEKFYKYCLKHKSLVCEECGTPIRNPSAYNVSHILTRGAFPEMAHDPRNVNILCPRHHDMWEHSTTRKGMRIEIKNEKIINQLKKEYNGS